MYLYYAKSGKKLPSCWSRALDRAPPCAAAPVGRRQAPLDNALTITRMSGTSTSSKDAALHAVGRTVVYFQRLEHNLKVLGRIAPFEGTLAKIRRDVEKREQQANTHTLGHAIQQWRRAILPTEGNPDNRGDMFEPTFRISFELDENSEALKRHFEALKALLEFRNTLIHGGLAMFDWESDDACRSLVAELTSINESIRSEMNFLVAVAKQYREALTDFKNELTDSRILDRMLPNQQREA